MPKTPKSPVIRDQRHNPLAEDLAPSNPWKAKASKPRKPSRDEGESYVDSNSSRKILSISRQLAEEAEAEEKNKVKRPPTTSSVFDFESRLGEDDSLEATQYDDEEAWGDEGEETIEADVDPNDLELFHKFIPTDDDPIKWGSTEESASGGGTDLAALILDKIAQHENGNQSHDIDDFGDQDNMVELPEKVVEVYSKIGLLLSRYKSGKLPKPFKILPTLQIWEDLIAITRPDEWSPNSVFAATRGEYCQGIKADTALQLQL